MLFIGLTYLSTAGSVFAVTPGSIKIGRGGSIYYGILNLAIYAAGQIENQSVEQIFRALIEVGGDTDTICSMTGQMLGSVYGKSGFPASWLEKFSQMQDKLLIEEIVKDWK